MTDRNNKNLTLEEALQIVPGMRLRYDPHKADRRAIVAERRENLSPGQLFPGDAYEVETATYYGYSAAGLKSGGRCVLAKELTTHELLEFNKQGVEITTEDGRPYTNIMFRVKGSPIPHPYRYFQKVEE